MRFIYVLLLMLFCIQITNAQPITPRDPDDIWAIQWSNDSTKLAIGYYNGYFQVFDTMDMSLIFQDIHANSPIKSLSWSPSNTKLAVGYLGDRIDIWDMIGFEKILTIPVGDLGIGYLTWSNDESYIFSGTGIVDGPTLRKYDLNTGILVDFIESGVFIGLTLLENDDFAIAFGYNTINLVNLNDLSYEFFYTFDESQGHSRGRTTTMSLHPSQEFIAIGHANYQVTIWDLETRQITTTLDAGMPFNDIYGVTDLAFNATGTRLFAVTYEGTIRSWDTTTWQLIEQTNIDGLILNADFSPDARQLAFGDLEQDAQIFMRDLCDFVAPDVASLLAILPQANTFGETAQICFTENATYILTSPLPTITGDITIIGNGATITMTRAGHVFDVAETGNLTLRDVIVLDGE